jgi:dipeptidyl aminopeptidase/acylaminoacyl peptidase
VLAMKIRMFLSALPLAYTLACASSPPPAPEPTQPAQPNTPQAAAKPQPKADPSLPPRALFSGNPDYINPQVSPDGKTLSWIAPFEGVLNVWTAPIDAPDKAQPLTTVKDRPLMRYHWAYDGKHLLYLKDSGGDENFHIYAVEVKTKKTRDLTDLPKVRAQLLAVSIKKPNEIAVALNDRDPRHHDVYKIELSSGKRTLLEKNEAGYMELNVDLDLNVRLASKERPDGGADLFKKGKGGKWEPFMTITMEDAFTTSPWTFDLTGKTLYMMDSRERNTAGAFAVDMATGKKTLIGDDPRADVSNAIFHPKTNQIQAIAVNYERVDWKIVDKSIEPDFTTLKNVIKGEIMVSSRSLDDKQWIVSDMVDDGPVRIYRYDRTTKTPHFLFVHRKAIDGMTLAKMHPVVVKSRDGLELVSYVSLPPSSDPEGDGKPNAPLPLVLQVHGGPWGRDDWGYSGLDQWLASRGYAVLSVNFRGSTGFGKSFLNAANGEWGRKMHDDLIDAVEWAVKSGVAQKDKIAIMGGSYGGYATLVGLTFTPDAFACGVDIVGPSNIQTLLETIPPYWAPMIEMFTKRIGGDHRTEEGRKFLAERSPLNFVEKIKRPLLIGQGANDPRVKQSESDQIVKAMQAKNIPVTYVVFPDEGHGFHRAENRTAFDAVTEAFLAQCLGGAYQPVGNDFAGSTITVPVGAEWVAGIEQALETAKTAQASK